MKVCIRCNPVSELLTDPEGNEYCHIHGLEFLAEDQPWRVEASPATPPKPVESQEGV